MQKHAMIHNFWEHAMIHNLLGIGQFSVWCKVHRWTVARDCCVL